MGEVHRKQKSGHRGGRRPFCPLDDQRMAGFQKKNLASNCGQPMTISPKSGVQPCQPRFIPTLMGYKPVQPDISTHFPLFWRPFAFFSLQASSFFFLSSSEQVHTIRSQFIIQLYYRPEGPTALCAATMSGSRRGLQDLCMELDSI